MLDLKDMLKNDPIVGKSYSALLHQSLENNDCKQASNYYLQYPNATLQESQKMPLFDCLYALALNKQAAQISQNMAQSSQDVGQKLAWLYRDTLNFAKLGDEKSTARAGRDTLTLAQISQNMAQSSQDVGQKLAWLYRDTLNFAKLGDEKSTARAGRDTLTLAKNLKNPQYYDVGFELFNALSTLEDKEGMLETYAFLKEFQANNPKMLQVNLTLLKKAESQKDELGIEIYLEDKEGMLETYAFLKEFQANNPKMLQVNLTLLKKAESQKDELGIEIYAKDILRLQNLLNDTADSPYVDFALAQSYIRTQRLNEALNVLDNLLKKDINDDNKQKALYLKGSVLKTSGQDSRAAFEQCMLINYEGAWKSLCAQALNILKGN